MIKNRNQWEWIKETLSKMEPVNERSHLGLKDRSSVLDMGTWGEMTDCGFAGCAIGHLVMFNPDQTLGTQEDLSGVIGFHRVASYFGLSLGQSLYAFSGHSGDTADSVIGRMEYVEKHHEKRETMGMD